MEAEYSYDQGRTLDGHPPGKRSKFYWTGDIHIPDDGEDDQLMLTGESEDTIYMATTKDVIVERKLTPQEMKMVDEAKDAALQPWLDNDAWEIVGENESLPNERCPMIFWL